MNPNESSAPKKGHQPAADSRWDLLMTENKGEIATHSAIDRAGQKSGAHPKLFVSFATLKDDKIVAIGCPTVFYNQ